MATVKFIVAHFLFKFCSSINLTEIIAKYTIHQSTPADFIQASSKTESTIIKTGLQRLTDKYYSIALKLQNTNN